MDKCKVKQTMLARRHRRVRGRVSGSAERPRLCVTRSNTNIYAQIIDDIAGVTLASASSVDKEVRADLKGGANIDAAKAVGMALGKRAADKGIKQVVFDRGGNLYHGRVKALADGAREAGLEF